MLSVFTSSLVYKSILLQWFEENYLINSFRVIVYRLSSAKMWFKNCERFSVFWIQFIRYINQPFEYLRDDVFLLERIFYLFVYFNWKELWMLKANVLWCIFPCWNLLKLSCWTMKYRWNRKCNKISFIMAYGQTNVFWSNFMNGIFFWFGKKTVELLHC